MPILCERHTTSKLRQFEDLQTLQVCEGMSPDLGLCAWQAELL